MVDPDRGDPDRYVPSYSAYGDPDRPEPEGQDPVGIAAVVCGYVGVVLFGLLLAVLTAILGAWAGQRARDAGRNLQQAYLALLFAAVDGVVWIALHLVFELPFWLG
jgi:hypothetical protein